MSIPTWKAIPPLETPSHRALPPGSGLVIAGLASILFWMMIAGIVVIA